MLLAVCCTVRVKNDFQEGFNYSQFCFGSQPASQAAALLAENIKVSCCLTLYVHVDHALCRCLGRNWVLSL
jgi:hypothetical protein